MKANQRGFVYLFSLGVVLFLVMASGSLLMRGITDTSVSERTRHLSEAFHSADSGIDQAAVNLRTPNIAADDVNARTLPQGAFSIVMPACVATGSCNTAGTFTITSHGISTREPGISRDVEAVLQLVPQSVFQFALFADVNLNVTGSATTDSYNSDLGPYQPDPGDPGYNQDHNGDVGTNATGIGGITVGGSIFIDGHMAVGPGVADPTSVVTGYDPAFITGEPKVSSQSDELPMPDVAVPAGLPCVDLHINGNDTVTLTPAGGYNGTNVYCYSNLDVEGGGALTASGEVVVYLTGTLTARGDSTIGTVNDPSNMTFLMPSGGSATLEEGTITGSTAFYGSLYGPDATINVQGNAAVFGAIVAEVINLTGSAEIHYDEALIDNPVVPSTYAATVVSWREL